MDVVGGPLILSGYRDGGRYRDRWEYDPDTGKVSGNPADSAEIEDLMRSIVNRSRASGDPRDHAEAMTIGDLRKKMSWSLEECPTAVVDAAIAMVKAGEQPPVEQVLFITEHTQGRACDSGGIVLWTR